MKLVNPLNQGNVVSAFLTEVKHELTQVTWPSREQTIRLTSVVIAVALGIGLYLGIIDYLLTQIMGKII